MSTYSYAMPIKIPNSQGNTRENFTINKNDFLECQEGHAASRIVSSNAANGTIDVLKDRIEKLEKEKSQLTQVNQLFAQQLNERELKYKKRVEQLELELDERKSTQLRLNTSLYESEEHVKILKHGKEELFLAVVNLNERIEMQNKTAAEAQTIWAKLPAAIKALKRLDDEAVKLRREKLESDIEKEHMSNTIAKLREAAEDRLVEMTLLKSKLEIERNNFYTVKSSLEEANVQTAGALATLADKLDESKATNVREKVTFHSERNALYDELERLRSQLTTRSMILESMNTPHKDDPQVDFRGKESFLAFVDDLKNNLLKSEMKRKQLHNQLQDLRGNIRVFVRTRPFLSCDGDEQFCDKSDPNIGGCVKFYKDNSSVSLTAAPNARDKPQVFSFDQVFRCESTQEDVYKQVSDLVQSALDGYKVCIFSYGQTGSGKTHTMTGDFNGNMRGIIPRSVEQIIEQVIEMRGNGWEIVVTMSMVEIYNEDLRDLLDSSPNSNNTYSNTKDKMKISNLQGFVSISGLTSVEINTQDSVGGMRQLEGLLDHAAKARMTACTAMNERSSRSHALFMLDIQAKHSDGVTFLKGGLRLVDLAGSERLDRTGTSSDPTRLKETVNINKSLSCLADVFISLGHKASHIPYRNSKLTMVLQDCLSGDGKALMFVNISPTHGSGQETLCSLRFANQVSQVELGKATRNVHSITPPKCRTAPHTPISNLSNSGKSVEMSSSANYERDRTLLINVVKSLQQVSEGTNSRIKKTSDKRAKSPKIPSRGRSSAGASGPIISHPVMTKGKVGKQDILSDTSSESTASRTPNGTLGSGNGWL